MKFDENGNVQLYDEEPLKLEVHQSYIYKQERNDNSLWLNCLFLNFYI